MGIVVVGVDASDSAHQAAAVAARLAADSSSRLHIVTALDKAPSVRVGGGSNARTVTPLERAEMLLATLASDFRPIAPEVTTTAAKGAPADVICEEARRLDADVIVVGNKRMQGASRVLGAVASKVVSHAPCDVYIAHTT